ncbi:hypothetical protein COT97_05845 [Candidatus Falkowbacteria bacterium CG10_big_fil_rev_8_21_14_0_10_39_11]|uniref:DNA 3'-5' helicase n=1 Tax=Candidatus Falkowbacteria bacterium CG10_big_fil_rev_8_21_14_0_10_39_11 TaxID=1974565 RepID=A0A2H0V3B2_9BACT|nr:MAG: hypothetical protein COT97_05845 [Candidatus Falkowbacteria bacterium CG10_big_fil_rev_8_21_14_0_10_39_11]
MPINYKQELNPEQLAVVTSGDGPCLVLAGAGSGKTRTLVYRVAYLLERGIQAENILLVTFTNKAATEMKERVKHLLGFNPDGLFAGTFHSIGNLLLRRYADKLGYNRSFNILDQEDSVNMVKSCMADMALNVKGQNFPKANVVHSIISYARNCNEDLTEVVTGRYGYPGFVAENFDRIAKGYDAKKKQANVMDFDDLLFNWLKLLEDFPEIRKHLSDQFKYILVDEYQDTNYIQAAVIKNLVNADNNILVVGDDSQSIYSFRAADVANILHFPKQFPGAQMYRIEKNYRSTPEILSLANEVIEHNQDKFEKLLQPVRINGKLPALIPARDVYQQAHLVSNKIIELQDKAVDYRNIAVLFRSTFHSAEIQLELAKRNIPFILRGGKRYFEQAHVKDMISHLKIMANFKDELSWKRVLRMYDGIGATSADNIWQFVLKYPSLIDLINDDVAIKSARAKNSWQRVAAMFQFLTSLDVTQKGVLAEAVIHVMEHGYKDYLKNTFDNYKDRLDDLHQFVDFVMTYDNLENLLADVMLSENFAKDNTKDKDNAVILSTIHQAKGLEWKYVMMIGVRNGDFPHHKSLDDMKQLEEERRLFYVAVTRAKDELYMFYPIRKNTFQYGEMTGGPSMFITEVNENKYTTTRANNFIEEDDPWDREETVYYD